MLKYGQQQEIADIAGIEKSYMSDIFNRKKQAPRWTAEELERASAKVLGKKNTIPKEAFVWSKTTKNKYFKGNPIYDKL